MPVQMPLLIDAQARLFPNSLFWLQPIVQNQIYRRLLFALERWVEIRNGQIIFQFFAWFFIESWTVESVFQCDWDNFWKFAVKNSIWSFWSQLKWIKFCVISLKLIGFFIRTLFELCTDSMYIGWMNGWNQLSAKNFEEKKNIFCPFATSNGERKTIENRFNCINICSLQLYLMDPQKAMNYYIKVEY